MNAVANTPAKPMRMPTMIKSLRIPTVSAMYPPNNGPMSDPARLADANRPKAQPVRSIGDSEAINVMLAE